MYSYILNFDSAPKIVVILSWWRLGILIVSSGHSIYSVHQKRGSTLDTEPDQPLPLATTKKQQKKQQTAGAVGHQNTTEMMNIP